PGGGDADLGLVPVVVAHADGAEHAAGGGALQAVRDVAGAGFDVRCVHDTSLVSGTKSGGTTDGGAAPAGRQWGGVPMFLSRGRRCTRERVSGVATKPGCGRD